MLLEWFEHITWVIDFYHFCSDSQWQQTSLRSRPIPTKEKIVLPSETLHRWETFSTVGHSRKPASSCKWAGFQAVRGSVAQRPWAPIWIFHVKKMKREIRKKNKRWAESKKCRYSRGQIENYLQSRCCSAQIQMLCDVRLIVSTDRRTSLSSGVLSGKRHLTFLRSLFSPKNTESLILSFVLVMYSIAWFVIFLITTALAVLSFYIFI